MNELTELAKITNSIETQIEVDAKSVDVPFFIRILRILHSSRTAVLFAIDE